MFRLLDTGFNDPFYNMALDEAILEEVAAGYSLPTLRLYGWNPPSVSIGYFQKVFEEIDVEYCRDNGIGLVRRPTGGRAVLHDNELTYSYIVPEASDHSGKGVIETYKRISTGILMGLKLLGVNAQWIEKPAKHVKSSICFNSSSWYEITCEGKKIVGSAQMRKKGVVLQHGSIIIDLDVDRMFNCFRFKTTEAKVKSKKIFLKKATSLNRLLKQRANFEVVKQGIVKGFEKGLNIQFKAGKVSDRESRLAQQLKREKYSKKEWNFRF
jgi:lipoate-protein ligase A